MPSVAGLTPFVGQQEKPVAKEPAERETVYVDRAAVMLAGGSWRALIGTKSVPHKVAELSLTP